MGVELDNEEVWSDGMFFCMEIRGGLHIELTAISVGVYRSIKCEYINWKKSVFGFNIHIKSLCTDVYIVHSTRMYIKRGLSELDGGEG